MRLMKQMAPAAEPARFDPSTWAQQAKLLARNEADATALAGALVLIGAAVVAKVAELMLDDVRLLPSDPASLLAIASAGLASVALLAVSVCRARRRRAPHALALLPRPRARTPASSRVIAAPTDLISDARGRSR